MNNQKVKKIVSLLPQCKDVFVEYAKFQNLLEVPQKYKEDYFNKFITQIAIKFVSYYENKSVQTLDAEQIITDFMEWLENTDVKFKIPQKKQQSKQRKRPSVSPKPIRGGNDSTYTPQLSPYQKNIQNQRRQGNTPQKIQGVRQFNVCNQQQRQIKKQSKERQYLGNEQSYGNGYGHGVGHQQRTKQSDARSIWTKLSQCLQYPQKRFYIFPQMQKNNKKY